MRLRGKDGVQGIHRFDLTGAASKQAAHREAASGKRMVMSSGEL